MVPPVLARLGAVLKRSAALLLLLLMVWTAPPAWADTPVSWNLVDADGQRLAALLFEQSDPAYPPGLRLRLNARSPGLAFDHQRPLQLMDSRGGSTVSSTAAQNWCPRERPAGRMDQPSSIWPA
jgi:hypothetical protein